MRGEWGKQVALPVYDWFRFYIKRHFTANAGYTSSQEEENQACSEAIFILIQFRKCCFYTPKHSCASIQKHPSCNCKRGVMLYHDFIKRRFRLAQFKRVKLGDAFEKCLNSCKTKEIRNK